MPDYTAMPNAELARQVRGLVGNTALLNAVADRLGGDDQPVYHSLMPMLELAIFSLESAYDDEPDLDARELREKLVDLLNFLGSRDTTVRETY